MRPIAIVGGLAAALLVSIAGFTFVSEVQRTNAERKAKQEAEVAATKQRQLEQAEAAARQADEATKLAEAQRVQQAAWYEEQELRREREASVELRETIATHWVELSNALIGECHYAVARQAERTAMRLDGASAWLVEMPEPLAVCLGAEECLKRTATGIETSIRNLAADAPVEDVAKLVKDGAREQALCAAKPAAQYTRAVTQTRSRAGAALDAPVRVFVVVLEAEPGSMARVSETIRARSDSAPTPFDAAMQTPGLDRFGESRAGVFAFLAPEGAAPTWTASLEVPLQVRGPDRSAVSDSLASFNVDAFPGGILESISRLALPGSQLEQARRELRRQGAALQARTDEARGLQNQVGNLSSELARAQSDREALERYNGKLEGLVAQHKTEDLVTQVVVAVASTATKTVLGWIFKL